MNEPDGVCIPKQVVAPHAGEMDEKRTLARICFARFPNATSMERLYDPRLTAHTRRLVTGLESVMSFSFLCEKMSFKKKKNFVF